MPTYDSLACRSPVEQTKATDSLYVIAYPSYNPKGARRGRAGAGGSCLRNTNTNNVEIGASL